MKAMFFIQELSKYDASSVIILNDYFVPKSGVLAKTSWLHKVTP